MNLLDYKMLSDLNKNNFYVFIIPDSKKHGAQNFFRRLHENFDSKNKMLVIEEKSSFIQNFFLLSKLSKDNKLKLTTTVNSNKLGLVFKIFHPTTTLISRLGNTISQEINRYTVKFFIHKFFYLLLTIFSKKIVFQSELMKKDFINFFNFHKSINKYLVIHNGVDSAAENDILMPDLIQAINLSKINFLLVGSFKHQKGYDIFFSALDCLDNALAKKIHFHVCGAGDEFEYFQKLLSNSKYQEIVTLHGELDPSFFYQHCNAYLLPSRYEGFSNSLIEALSYGLPAIVADCPSANREVIEENFNGIFFVNENYQDLHRKINYMSENHAQFDQGLIKQDVKNRFSISVIASIYKDLYT